MSNANSTTRYKEAYVIREGKDGNSHWTRIGVAFVNKDDSLTLKLDLVPTNFAEVTINIRDPKPRDTSD